MCNNVDGVKSKEDSLNSTINIFNKPSCVVLQETKLGAKVKYDISDYLVFQRNRNSFGEGLITAVVPELDPFIVSNENEDAEILVVQMKLGTRMIRLINTYAPQDADTLTNCLEFTGTGSYGSQIRKL